MMTNPQTKIGLKDEDLTREIISAGIEVHRQLGPGLLESAYELCLAHELSLRGFKLEQQKALPVIYKGVKLDCSYRTDLIVEDRVIIELKCVDEIAPVHDA